MDPYRRCETPRYCRCQGLGPGFLVADLLGPDTLPFTVREREMFGLPLRGEDDDSARYGHQDSE